MYEESKYSQFIFHKLDSPYFALLYQRTVVFIYYFNFIFSFLERRSRWSIANSRDFFSFKIFEKIPSKEYKTTSYSGARSGVGLLQGIGRNRRTRNFLLSICSRRQLHSRRSPNFQRFASWKWLVSKILFFEKFSDFLVFSSFGP